MAERHTFAEWRDKLIDPSAKLTLEEFRALESYYAAGALARMERLCIQQAADAQKCASIADMLGVWLIAAVQTCREYLPWGQIIPPYPASLVGRMDLKDAQRIHDLEIERRQELVAHAAGQAQAMARTQSG